MLSKELISEIKKRLLSKFDIEKIILFGSQARGSANKKSDVDLLIITNSIKNRLKLIDKIDGSLEGLKLARDIIVLSEKEFESDKMIPGTIARYAYKEGKTLYEK
jgi:predicted nucleotidyltransferase